jgi:glutamyl-tRNA synthetase
VGHARTFWTAHQRAKKAQGTLVIRMDDLDPDRCRPEYAEAAIEDLRWLGIRWQEGPGNAAADKAAGAYGPYLQSKRMAIYLDVFRALQRRGHLYPCRCSRKDLATSASAPHESQQGAAAAVDDELIYPGTCRPGPTRAEAAEPEQPRSGSWQHPRAEIGQLPGPTAGKFGPEAANWRFRVPEGMVVEFQDLNLGPQRFVAGMDFGDFLVWRRDGVPSYQLACAVDDAAMAITEVVRGADLLKSTARQILLLRALGVPAPKWFHCALVADHNGQRLAKRHDALSLRALRARGITPMGIFSAELPVLA